LKSYKDGSQKDLEDSKHCHTVSVLNNLISLVQSYSASTET